MNPKQPHTTRRPAIVALLLSALLGLTSCAPVMINGCVIAAANRECVLDAQYALDPSYHRQLIMIQYRDRPKLGHCYLYYELTTKKGSKMSVSAQAYDEGGTRWLKFASRNPRLVGAQLAGGNLLSAEWIKESTLSDPPVAGEPDEAEAADPQSTPAP